ncbi:MAG: lytic transglycosylase domain-containing protein [Christensenellales bacterium]|nr:lytic transglycosylase domain-containing protein [Christensenellales bacterium]
MARNSGRQAQMRAARRRKRLTRRIVGVVMVVVLAMGIGGLGLWLLLDGFPQMTMLTCVVKYEDLIRQYAQQNQIPAAYVASVVMAESSYRPEAVSSENAQGLMQILPSTAEWIAPKLGESYIEGSLFDPETNLRYGCWYLGFLMERFDGDMRCVTAGYHAGQGKVDQWLENPEYSSDGKTLEFIPYDSTRAYVNRIEEFYRYYEDIYV